MPRVQPPPSRLLPPSKRTLVKGWRTQILLGWSKVVNRAQWVLVGTIRRECLDFLIPLNERHLQRILKEWVAHYNRGRPHSSLGPGIPDQTVSVSVKWVSGHRIPDNQRVLARSEERRVGKECRSRWSPYH